IPAHAGIQGLSRLRMARPSAMARAWIPACAGMTGGGGVAALAHSSPLGSQCLALCRPVDQPLALLLDYRGGGVGDEGFVRQLALALGDLRVDLLQLFVEAGAF